MYTVQYFRLCRGKGCILGRFLYWAPPPLDGSPWRKHRLMQNRISGPWPEATAGRILLGGGIVCSYFTFCWFWCSFRPSEHTLLHRHSSSHEESLEWGRYSIRFWIISIDLKPPKPREKQRAWDLLDPLYVPILGLFFVPILDRVAQYTYLGGPIEEHVF